MDNVFAGVFSLDSTRIRRTAVAEYQGPVPLGSPTNNLCDQPPLGSPWVSKTPPPVVNITPRCWVNIAGQDTDKSNGDRLATPDQLRST